eukprot:CAMPEP_0178969988 /NCGR_PEP_ID=MMETSP0789-20121207/19222_1 /TAXON_ID=3005 /ORGANISM="Rhizosolenia setigera, Strain CCMP 1694" /LENGTH=272 /DNA_ID=CAMNT_0020656303 /DNA_START=5 /DNA_END=823 /DNA_ORIENTATION=+
MRVLSRIFATVLSVSVLSSPVRSFLNSAVARNTKFSTSTTSSSSCESSSFVVKSSRKDETWFDDKDINEYPIRFLGKGSNAIVREGVVLVAPKHEYHHFLMKSAIFIYAIGVNQFNEKVSRGVIIDHPTAFTMGEMAPGAVYGPLGNNILFQGGDQGPDTAIMLHSRGDSIHSKIKDSPQMRVIGTSGIFEGGLQIALDEANEGVSEVDDFKFFFNYVEFTDAQMENMLDNEDSEGDAWFSVEVPPSLVLDSDLARGDAWRSLRNKVRDMIV